MKALQYIVRDGGSEMTLCIDWHWKKSMNISHFQPCSIYHILWMNFMDFAHEKCGFPADICHGVKPPRALLETCESVVLPGAWQGKSYVLNTFILESQAESVEDV
jgi:hypothetical protein